MVNQEKVFFDFVEIGIDNQQIEMNIIVPSVDINRSCFFFQNSTVMYRMDKK